MGMESTTCVKKVQMLNGRLITLNRFLSRSTDKCKLFFQAIKKNRANFRWNEDCEAAFQGLRRYLASLPLLSKPITGETLFLFLEVSESVVSGALVWVDEGVQKSVYYVDKSLLDAETRYQRMEKVVLTLFEF